MKRYLKNTVIFISCIFFFGILLEEFFQCIEFEMPYHKLDPKVGKKMIPNKRICYFNEGFYLGKVNKYGYLGTAYPHERTSGKTRIALLGDSYTEGFQLLKEKHFSSLLEEKLNQEKSSYEVLNFGVSDYRYNDMAIQYQNFVKGFNPDILIFILANASFLPPGPLLPTPKLASEKSQLSVDYSFTESGKYKVYQKLGFLIENSCLIKSLSNCYKLAIRGELNANILGKFYRDSRTNKRKSPFTIKNIPVEVPMSLNWYKNKQVYFVFWDAIPPAFLQETALYPNISVYSLDQILQPEDSYWKITDEYGHWNEKAQIKVADFLMENLNFEP